VTLDDESSSVPGGPFTWKTKATCELREWISTERFDYVSGEHHGFMRFLDTASLERSILFLKGDYWIVCDKLSSPGDHQGDVRFHFDSSTKPLLNGALRDAESGLSIWSFANNGQWIEEDRWISYCYGQKEQSKAYSFAVRFKDGDRVFSFLLPEKGEKSWQVREVKIADARAFVVGVGKRQDLVMISDHKQSEWVWVRFSGDQVEEVVTLPEKRSFSEEELRMLYAEVNSTVALPGGF
jgi:hypothetical protein